MMKSKEDCPPVVKADTMLEKNLEVYHIKTSPTYPPGTNPGLSKDYGK